MLRAVIGSFSSQIGVLKYAWFFQIQEIRRQCVFAYVIQYTQTRSKNLKETWVTNMLMCVVQGTKSCHVQRLPQTHVSNARQ